MKGAQAQGGLTPSQLITKRIEELPDWRGKLLTRLRKLVLEAAPGITEDLEVGSPGPEPQRPRRRRRGLQGPREAEFLQRGIRQRPEASLQRRP